MNFRPARRRVVREVNSSPFVSNVAESAILRRTKAFGSRVKIPTLEIRSRGEKITTALSHAPDLAGSSNH